MCSELSDFFFLIEDITVISIWPSKHAGVSDELPATIFYRDIELPCVLDEISIQCDDKCTPVKLLLVAVCPLSVLASLPVCACSPIHVFI